jgi:hypothetical protein
VHDTLGFCLSSLKIGFVRSLLQTVLPATSASSRRRRFIWGEQRRGRSRECLQRHQDISAGSAIHHPWRICTSTGLPRPHMTSSLLDAPCPSSPRPRAPLAEILRVRRRCRMPLPAFESPTAAASSFHTCTERAWSRVPAWRGGRICWERRGGDRHGRPQLRSSGTRGQWRGAR